MTNMELASQILEVAAHSGVREIVLCSGARNAPLVTLLSRPTPFKVYPFFEERSAGFFALGRIQATGRPVGVITTSGTAAAELLPAVVEAHYQGLPLILITADRPRHHRGSGSPQAIEQVGLYSHYVEETWDVENGAIEALTWSQRRPVHLNVCFAEPLIDGPTRVLKGGDMKPDVMVRPVPCVPLTFSKPLVIVGGLPHHQQNEVLSKLCQWGRPVYCEAHSGLRGHPGLKGIAILGGEKGLGALDYDGIIRIGSVPTLRLWRDLETAHCPVVHFSHLPFAGLPRAPEVFPLEALGEANFEEWSGEECARDRALGLRLQAWLDEFPLSEPAWVREVSRWIPAEARVFLGNSLPIREWDLAAEKGHAIFANRGANGIDGQISTFLGVASPGHSNWAVLGDLTVLYDLSGLWAARQTGVEDLHIVILNNGGGKIFERMFHNPLFENEHALHFGDWAKMWGWNYQLLERGGPCQVAAPRVIEILPDRNQTQKFWQAWEEQA